MRSVVGLVRLGCWGGLCLLGASCADPRFAGLSAAACPQLSSGDPLTGSFSMNATANTKIRAFVAAAQSLHNVSVQMEAMATEACHSSLRSSFLFSF